MESGCPSTPVEKVSLLQNHLSDAVPILPNLFSGDRII